MRTYVVWDGDGNKEEEKKRNARLLSLLGLSTAEIGKRDWLGATTVRYACYKTHLEDVLRSDMGEELYDRLVDEYATTYRLRKKDSKKPLLVYLLIREMRDRGIRPAALGRIVKAILDGDAAEGSSGPA